MNMIKRYREAARLTQSQVAEGIGVSQGAIAHYENARRIPDLETCRKLVQLFTESGAACTLDEVFPAELEKTG